MVLEFIPAWLWAILLIVSILGLIFKNRIARSLAGRIPFVSPDMALILFAVLGIMFGGWGLIMTWVGGITGGVASVASIGTTTTPSLASEAVIDYCDYSASSQYAGTTERRRDPNSNNRLYYDIDSNVSAAQDDVYVNFTCCRKGQILEDGVARIVVKGDKFKSEVSTTDSNTYTTISTSSRPSTVWPGEYTQTVYVGDGNGANTANPQDGDYLTYAEGEKCLTLGIYAEFSTTGLLQLNNYTQKDIVIYQRSETNGETALAYITANKILAG